MIILSCGDAPRDNPLDPLSPYPAPVSVVSGTVAVAGPGTPIAGALVTCLESGLTIATDASGTFQFDRLTAGTWTFSCAVDFFDTETSVVSLDLGGMENLGFRLNAPPIATSQKITTHKVDQYFPSPQYYVDVFAAVTDPNGVTEVASVWIVVDTLSRTMPFSPTSGFFEARLFKYDIPTNTIQWLVGKPLHIGSKDIHGSTRIGDPFVVTRVIENGATPVSPASGSDDTTGTQPTLVWSPPSVTFTYSYTLTIARIEAGTQTIVWTLSGVNSVLQSLGFPGDGSGTQLIPGNYVWSISVIDEFGNSCRSKEAAFVVQ